MPTDEALARHIQQGHSDALAGLVDRYYDPLVGYLYRMTGGDRMLSEDMVQETFLRVLKGIGGYEYPRPFKPWLYAIATNLVRNHFKRADTRRTIAADDDNTRLIAAPTRSPEDALTADADRRDLLAALNAVPDHQREVIVLRYAQELSLAEIATTLDIPVGTVKSRLSIGLRRLREAMTEDGA